MSLRPLRAIVLAAGEGTRMRSRLPKPLHRLCGRPMVLHVLDALAALGVDRVVVVVGHESVAVTKAIEAEAPLGLTITFVDQNRQLGTGDAAAVGLTGFVGDGDLDEGDLLVLPGDTPLISAATLRDLVDHHRRAGLAATLLSAHLADPTGYGRVIRNRSGGVSRIVEQLDATDDERAVNEVGTAIYCFDHALLAPSLRRISPHNAQGEYYLTDVIGVLATAGYEIGSYVVEDAFEVAGVNDREQLSRCELAMRRRINAEWMRRGVTMLDPGAVYLDASVRLGEEVTLYPSCVLEGRTIVEDGVTLHPGCHLTDTVVGAGATVSATVAHQARIGSQATVGPFCVLPPGSEIKAGETAGPFFSCAPPF